MSRNILAGQNHTKGTAATAITEFVSRLSDNEGQQVEWQQRRYFDPPGTANDGPPFLRICHEDAIRALAWGMRGGCTVA